MSGAMREARAIREPLPFKGHRTLAAVWGITVGSHASPQAGVPKPAPEPPKQSYAGFDQRERQFR